MSRLSSPIQLHFVSMARRGTVGSTSNICNGGILRNHFWGLCRPNDLCDDIFEHCRRSISRLPRDFDIIGLADLGHDRLHLQHSTMAAGTSIVWARCLGSWRSWGFIFGCNGDFSALNQIWIICPVITAWGAVISIRHMGNSVLLGTAMGILLSLYQVRYVSI